MPPPRKAYSPGDLPTDVHGAFNATVGRRHSVTVEVYLGSMDHGLHSTPMMLLMIVLMSAIYRSLATG
jgi:hypothetical protein